MLLKIKEARAKCVGFVSQEKQFERGNIRLSERIEDDSIYQLYVAEDFGLLYMYDYVKQGEFGEPYSTVEDMINRLPSLGKIGLVLFNTCHSKGDEESCIEATIPDIFNEWAALKVMTEISSHAYPLKESIDEDLSKVIVCILDEQRTIGGLLLTGEGGGEMKVALCTIWTTYSALQRILILVGEAAAVKGTAKVITNKRQVFKDWGLRF